MSWKRLGRIYSPDGSKPWARTHASLPVPVPRGGDLFRFFVSTRDAANRSHVGWVDVDLHGVPTLVDEAQAPVLSPGEPGSFDDDGVSIGSIVALGAEQRLYYMGWNLGTRAPWRNAIGLAHAHDANAPFERFSVGPILDRSPEDPFTLSYPWVMRMGADNWRMWYGSNTRWGSSSADMSHVIKTARSRDGIRWERDGRTTVGFASASETALARPSVLQMGDGSLMMWFACRGERYRIGAGSSLDGASWERRDEEAGLAPASAGWDSEMTCYPCAFSHRERLWLAYNGNGYGATGFGLAIWEGALS